MAKPGSITPHTKFEAKYMYCQKKKVVVIRHSLKVTAHSSTSVQQTLQVLASLPEGVEMVMPGDNIKMDVELDCTDRDGRRFTLRYP